MGVPQRNCPTRFAVYVVVLLNVEATVDEMEERVSVASVMDGDEESEASGDDDEEAESLLLGLL